jgi:hypothetical protein
MPLSTSRRRPRAQVEAAAVAAAAGELERERALRVEAQDRARTAARALEQLAAEAKADSHAVGEEARAEMRAEIRAELRTVVEAAQAEAFRARQTGLEVSRELALWRLLAAAGCRGRKIYSAVTLTRDRIAWEDDGTPTVKATGDANVEAFFAAYLREQLPEWIEHA